MKKILFTIQWYPPKRSANALCDSKIINKLLEQDKYEIHCLVYKQKENSFNKTNRNIHIHEFSKGVYYNCWVNFKNSHFKLLRVISMLMLRIQQVLTLLIYPCYEPLATMKFARAAKKLHKKEKFDLVISEHHGFDSLYAGYALEKYDKNIKFIPILWDPFTGKEPAKYLPKCYAENKLLKSEKKILSNADCIIALESSREYHRSMSKTKPYYDKYKFLDIPGIVEPQPSETAAKFVQEGKINIVYSGVLSLPERDPSYIVNLLNQTSCAKDINLIFLAIGNGTDKLPALKKDFNGNMIISGYVSREEINAIYHKADILINIGGSNPYMVPSKIFEYMSYGKTILSTYYIDNESSKKYLSDYPLGLCIDVRKPLDYNRNLFEKFVDSNKNKKMQFDDVKKLFPKNLPESYVDVIREVLRDDNE